MPSGVFRRRISPPKKRVFILSVATTVNYTLTANGLATGSPVLGTPVLATGVVLSASQVSNHIHLSWVGA